LLVAAAVQLTSNRFKIARMQSIGTSLKSSADAEHGCTQSSMDAEQQVRRPDERSQGLRVEPPTQPAMQTHGHSAHAMHTSRVLHKVLL
jgi:hypothetical protein